MPYPVGNIDSPIGALLPGCKGIGAAHQQCDLGRILNMLLVLVAVAGAESPPHDPQTKKKYFHFLIIILLMYA